MLGGLRGSWKPNMNSNTIVAIDAETTGLGSKAGRIDAVVQAGYAVRVGDVVESWHATCNPGDRFLEGGRAATALRINGLSLDSVLKAPPATAVAAELRERLASIEARTGLPVELRAYNAAFDRPFFMADPWRLTQPWGPCIMLAACHALTPDGKWPRLAEAIDMLGLPRLGVLHNAEHDARLALMVDEALHSVIA